VQAQSLTIWSDKKMADTPTYIKANGQTFACDVAGSGDTVALCLHGFPESRYSWRYQLPLLEEHGLRAIAPDLRGYGQSSRPPERDAYRLAPLVDDIEGLFQASGAKRRILIAHDWGALLAWAYAMANPGKLDGLIIMNVPHPVVTYRKVPREVPGQLLKSWYIYFFQLPWLPEFALRQNGARAVGRAFTGSATDLSHFSDHVLDVYRKNALQPGALTAMLNYYRVAFWELTRLGRQSPPPIIDAPTLVVWGEEDIAIDVALSGGYDGLINDWTIERLPGVSHWVQQDAPEKVNAILADWLVRKGLSAKASKA
jgi:epoxide hydrolase 4